MKIILLTVLLQILIVFNCSIFDQPNENNIKVTNNYGSALNNVFVGPLQFGTLENNQTTDYQKLEGGMYEISAITQSDQILNKNDFVVGRYLSINIVFKSDGSIEEVRE